MSDFKKYLSLNMREIKAGMVPLLLFSFAGGLLNDSVKVSAIILLFICTAITMKLHRIYSIDTLSEKAYMIILFPLSENIKALSKFTAATILQTAAYGAFALGSMIIELLTEKTAYSETFFIGRLYEGGTAYGAALVFTFLLAISALSMLMYRLSYALINFAIVGHIISTVPVIIVLYYVLNYVTNESVKVIFTYPLPVIFVCVFIAVFAMIGVIKLGESEDNTLL